MKHLLVILSLLLAGSASALPIANPYPTQLGSDTNGSGLFRPQDWFVSLEVLDLGPMLTGGPMSPFPSNGFGGAEFGFYYANDPGTRIAIFDPTDQNPDPNGPGSVQQYAAVDFLSGQVFDYDAGNTLQSTFAGGTVAPIGFYLTLSQDLVDFFGFGFNTMYSQASLNPGDQDMAAAYPLLDGSGYLLGFAAANPYSATGEYFFFGASIATRIAPLVSVPEPDTWALLLIGVLVLLLFRRMRSQVSDTDRSCA